MYFLAQKCRCVMMKKVIAAGYVRFVRGGDITIIFMYVWHVPEEPAAALTKSPHLAVMDAPMRNNG